MTMDNNENLLFEIVGQIQQGKSVLFLGAGASHAAGGPTGKKLTEMISHKISRTSTDKPLPKPAKSR